MKPRTYKDYDVGQLPQIVVPRPSVPTPEQRTERNRRKRARGKANDRARVAAAIAAGLPPPKTARQRWKARRRARERGLPLPVFPPSTPIERPPRPTSPARIAYEARLAEALTREATERQQTSTTPRRTKS